MSDFLWAGGIEDTFISDPHPITGRTLDEYVLTHHYDLWRNDFDAVKSIGINALRWGMPWYKVEPQKGKWDWSWTDNTIPYLTQELGIKLILDLMHYGTPGWLEGYFVNPDYPGYVAEYTSEVINRYGKYLEYVTPFNEPHTACRLCGLTGDWPPYRKGYKGYLDVFRSITKGAQMQTALLHDNGLKAVQVECSGGSFTDYPELKAQAEIETLCQYMFFDFLTGQLKDVSTHMEFFNENGFSDEDFDFFSAHSVDIDIMGINFYPQFNFKDIKLTSDGKTIYFDHPVWTDTLEAIIKDRVRKYHCPVMITETSIKDDELMKISWLKASTELAVKLVHEGVPLAGYTWFPLIDMYEWKYRFMPEITLADFEARFGMITIDRRIRHIASIYRKIINDNLML